jgi:dATP pyrophosphohydrolase
MSEAAPSARTRTPIIRVFDCHVARPRAAGSYEYLLLQRSKHKIYADSWRMVGGKLKPEETAWQAFLRELGEETRLPVARLFAVPYINRFYEWQHDRINDIPVFLALTVGGTDPILDDEHSDFAWLPLDRALGRLPWPGQREGLRAADALLGDDLALHPFLEVDLRVTR